MPPSKDVVASLTDEIKFLLAAKEKEKKDARKRERKLLKKRKKKEAEAAALAAAGEALDNGSGGGGTLTPESGSSATSSESDGGDDTFGSSGSSSGSSESTSSDDDECEVTASVRMGRGIRPAGSGNNLGGGRAMIKGPPRVTELVDYDDIINLYKAFKEAVGEVRREAYRAPNLNAVATFHQEHLVECQRQQSLLSTPTGTPRAAQAAPPSLASQTAAAAGRPSSGGSSSAPFTPSPTPPPQQGPAASASGSGSGTTATSSAPLVTLLPTPQRERGGGGNDSALPPPPVSPQMQSGSLSERQGSSVYFASGAGSTMGSPLRISLEQTLISLKNFVLKDMPDIKNKTRTAEEVRARVRLMMSEPMRRIAKMIYDERDAFDYDRVSQALVKFCDITLETHREEQASRASARLGLRYFSSGGGTSSSGVVFSPSVVSPPTPEGQQQPPSQSPTIVSQSPILPASVGAIFGMSPTPNSASPQQGAVGSPLQCDGDGFMQSPALKVSAPGATFAACEANGAMMSNSASSSGGGGASGGVGGGLNIATPSGSGTASGGSVRHLTLPMPRFGLGGHSPPPTPTTGAHAAKGPSAFSAGVGGGGPSSSPSHLISTPSSFAGTEGAEVIARALDELLATDNLPSLKVATAIVLACRDILAEETALVSVPAPCVVVGDIHGQLSDLRRIIDKGGPLGVTTYLFLGDYVDRGPASVHVMLLLAAAKVLYPDKIFLLRGNHESKNINSVYGFLAEIERKYPKHTNGRPSTPRAVDLFAPMNSNNLLFLRFNEMFRALPLAAIVDNSIFCVHGGLSRYITSVESILCVDRFREIDDGGAIADLCWSDPAKIRSYQHNWRGSGCQFGADVTLEFLRSNNLRFVCRAHQCVKEGYQWSHDNRLVTIFSATNYCGLGNSAAIMRVEPMPNGVGRARQQKQKQLHSGHRTPATSAAHSRDASMAYLPPALAGTSADNSPRPGGPLSIVTGASAEKSPTPARPFNMSPRPDTELVDSAPQSFQSAASDDPPARQLTTTVLDGAASLTLRSLEPFDGIAFEVLDIEPEAEAEAEAVVVAGSDGAPSPNPKELPHHFS